MDGRRRVGAGRPRKACSTCKTQKIRCTEERPSCKRCVRLHHVCTYSDGASPSRSSKAPQQGNAQSDVLSRDTGTSGAQDATYAPPYRNDPGEGRRYLGLLEHLLPELVEIYFNCVYNAHLLLHKRTFLASVVDGMASTHVVLSVCAWGAKFYEDASGLPVLKTQGFMLEWAQKAGKLVLQDAEELVWENVVTFMNLALFWHSQGSWRRAYFHKGNAFLLLDLLGLGPKSCQIDSSLESEIRRRRYWACYVMHCHTFDNSTQFELKGDLLQLPLPWLDEEFDAGVGALSQVTLSSERSGGIFAELIKAGTIWHSVVSLLKSPETSLQTRVPAILAFDERLQKWWRTVQPGLKLTPQNVKSIPPAIFTRVLHLNALYHQSFCALHASLVPLFCCSPGDDGWSVARQLSAQIAFEHAGTMSSLIAAVLETTSRTSAVPMFLGYTAYCGCAIQMPFMWCSNPTIRERIHVNVSANTKLLQLMSVDWKFASILSAYIHYLYIVHSKRAIVLEDEPIRASPEKLTSFDVDACDTRSSIFEYIAMFRTEGGGYGGSENGEDNIPGDVNVSDSQKISSKTAQGPTPVPNNPTSDGETKQTWEHVTEQPVFEGGNVMDLLYPFTTDPFGLPFDDEMPELPFFDMGQFELDNIHTAP
ncbi:hypothetical protein GGR55DRAFT_634031 [Xylaria sp. FL0064]|nr:hypothetical protein GGR55DRAFT_634031 [Xylaria sp. FL0064]